MARRWWTYRFARRNASRSPLFPFVPQRPPAVHQPDRLTLRAFIRQMVRNNSRYLRP